MEKSPCQTCNCRKIVCHDHCEEYLEWHEELVAAKKELREVQKVIDNMIAGCRRSIKRRHLR